MWQVSAPEAVSLRRVCALAPLCQKEYTSGVLSAIALGPTLAGQGPTERQHAPCPRGLVRGKHGVRQGRMQWIRVEYLSVDSRQETVRGGPCSLKELELSTAQDFLTTHLCCFICHYHYYS